MKKLVLNILASLISGVLLAAPAAACDYPRSPVVPNGEVASKEEMQEAQVKVRAFVAAAEAYLDCLQAMESSSDTPLPPRQTEINVARYNAMVDEMHRISDEYNVAVRIFKARQP